MYDLADIAWAAGLFEGEGTMYLGSRQRIHTGSTRSDRVEHLHRASVRMTDPEPLARMQRIFGGTFRGPYREPNALPHHKPKYLWQLTSWKNLLPFCEAIRPFLSPRRIAQMDRVLAGQPRVPRGTMPCHLPVEPSWSGYQKHRALQETPCDRCRRSHQLAIRERYLRTHPDAKNGVQRLGS